jgi:hypothetical protein
VVLQAFDPELRKQLGVWYTPPEIVQYMVARVDTVLREELNIEDGLADPRVYVLDPCCGIDVDRDRLISRMKMYFDPNVPADQLGRIATSAVQSTARFDAIATRDYLCGRGLLSDHVVRYAYRPFDSRWIYWEPETKLLDEKRGQLFGVCDNANWFLTSRQKAERSPEIEARTKCAESQSPIGVAVSGTILFRAPRLYQRRMALRRRRMIVRRF